MADPNSKENGNDLYPDCFSKAIETLVEAGNNLSNVPVNLAATDQYGMDIFDYIGFWRVHIN